ncbi:MAG: acyl-CoA desaturase [Actinomycetales bacterium]|nr:acyl-CoA desaturase [Actinomycetales bacterium]
MTLTPEIAPTTGRTTDDVVQLQSTAMRVIIGVFIVLPMLAVVAAIPIALNGWITWLDVVLVLAFWAITGLGITLGYHRYFTHGSFKAPRGVKIALGIMGSMALQGSVAQWVADHRKHHKFSDEVGDPHSPWRYGTSRRAVAKGLFYSHIAWIFEEQNSAVEQYAPDLRADKDLDRISRLFPLWVTLSLLLPAVLGGLLTWSWIGALTAFFWAGLVRIAFLHHVTWSINSICHVFGKRPFKGRDLSSNVAWLAIPSFGESWHNLHHAEPTAARHGVLKGQVDPTAAIIRAMERLHLARDVRWPKPERVAAKLVDPGMRSRVRGYVEPASSGA